MRSQINHAIQLSRPFIAIALLSMLALSARADDNTVSPPTSATAAPSVSPIPADVQAAMNMPAGPDRKAAISTAVQAWAKTNSVDAIMCFGAVHDSALQRSGLEAATAVWIADDEKAATDWGLNHHASGVEQHFLFGAYGHKDRQVAAEWILQQPNHNAGEFGVIVEAWMGHEKGNEKTVSDVAAWVVKQKLAPEDANAAAFFVAVAMAGSDPVAASAWVTRIQARAPQKTAAVSVASNWSRKIPADIPKIEDWIKQLPLTDDAKAEVAKAIVRPTTETPPASSPQPAPPTTAQDQPATPAAPTSPSPAAANDSVTVVPANIAPTPITAPPQTPVKVFGEPRMTQGHPCTLWDQQDIDEIKERLKTDPDLQKKFATLKDEMDKRITEPLDVPEVGGPPLNKDRTHRNAANASAVSNLGTMYVLTGDEKYGEYAKKLLVAYAQVYPKLPHPVGWTVKSYRSAQDGRLGGQFLDDGGLLIRLARGADLIYNVSTWTPEERKLVREDLFEAISAEFYDPAHPTDKSYINETHNRSALCTSGVLMAGYATDDQMLINLALYGVNGTADKPTGGVMGVHFTEQCIFPDGLWDEGAPGYQLGITACGLMNDVETLWHHGIDLYRYNNCIFKRLLDSPFGLAYPDDQLHIPALHDSAPTSLLDAPDWWSNEEGMPYEYGYRRYRDPAYLPMIKKSFNNLTMSIHNGPPSLFQDLPDDDKVPARKIESANYFAVGYGVLRLPASKGYNQLLMEFGPTGSHAHPSKLGIDLYAMEDSLMPFPGVIFPYDNPMDPKWYWTTLGNCALTVDEKSQLILANMFQAPKGTPHPNAKQVIFGPATTMGIQRGWADNLYAEKIVQDRSLFLTSNYMADLFEANADVTHKYDLAWHLRGTFPADMKMEPYSFPAPVANGYNALTNVQHVSTDQPWSTTITMPKGTPARLFTAGGTPTEIITGNGLFFKETPPTIIERRVDQKSVLFGTAVDLSGGTDPYIKGVTQEGGFDAGYSLLKVQTVKGTDLCFSSYRPGAFTAGGLDTDAQQALVLNDGPQVQALYLGGGKSLKFGGASITRSDVGLAYVEKLDDGSYVVANPSPADATITVTLPALDNLTAYLVDQDGKQLGAAPVTKAAGTHMVTIPLKADSRAEFLQPK